MKMIVHKNIVRNCALVMAVLIAFLVTGFKPNPGGDSYLIYLNDKLLVEQFVLNKQTVKTISLADAGTGDVLQVYYNHCGKIGLARTLILKDKGGKVLKSWKFDDAPGGEKNRMSVKVRELSQVQASSGYQTLSLIYTSEQLPAGMLLTHLDLSKKTSESLQ